MFGWEGTLTPERTAQVARTKQVIYDGFKAAVPAGVPKKKAGIIVDEQFGTAIPCGTAASVSDFEPSNFELVSDFEFRVSDFKSSCSVYG